MSKELDTEVEKKEPGAKNIDIDIEGEGIPRTFNRSEDYRRGYKAGWLVAKNNILKKLSQSGQIIEQKSIEEKRVDKKKSKKEEEVSLLTWVVVALVLGGITLFVFFNEYNRERNQPTGQ